MNNQQSHQAYYPTPPLEAYPHAHRSINTHPESSTPSQSIRHAPHPSHRKTVVVQGSFIGGRPRTVIQPTPMRTAQPHGGGEQTAFALPSLPPSGPGQQLPEEVRTKMETAFGADFSDVRVHIGPQASSIGALAYTHGSDIYFAPGLYNPMTFQGQQLLGHELTHVLQQRSGRVRNPLGSGVAVVQDPSLESEADRQGLKAAMSAVQRRPAPAQSHDDHAPQAVQRQAIQQYTVRPPIPGNHGGQRITVTMPGGATPVGSVNIRPTESGKMEITDLEVSQEHRRHGVGTQLVQSALRNAQRQGVPVASLEARPSDSSIQLHSLVSMYQKMGFKIVGSSSRGNPLLECQTGMV